MDVVFVLVIFVCLAMAGGLLFGSVLDKIVHSRMDCPLCWASIPAKSEICPKCKATL